MASGKEIYGHNGCNGPVTMEILFNYTVYITGQVTCKSNKIFRKNLMYKCPSAHLF